MVKIDTTNFNLKKKIVLEKWGEILKQEMIHRAPKEYGTMAASIESKQSGDEVEVGTNTGEKYPIYVEYGTGTMVKAHGSHVPWAPVRDWEALRKRGDLKVKGGVTIETGQTMPFARSSSFFTEPDRLNYLKQVFK